MCGGVRWWMWLSVDGDQELGREDKNWCRQGTGVAAPLQGLGLCCVTPGLRDPSCPTLPCSCPGNQGPLIHPELPSPWSGGETAGPLVGAGVATPFPPSIPVMLPPVWPCYRFGAEWRPQPHCWAGLLQVGGVVGGPHCQLPLLAVQSLLPAPVRQWHDILRIWV